jgi:hypothetical protein
MDDKKNGQKKAKPAEAPVIAGHVAGISAGSGDAPYRFEVTDKKGKNRAFVLDAANATRFAAMTALVNTAFVAGKKLHVRGTANGADLMVATDIRLGQKSKEPKTPKAKPGKSVKVETAAAPGP